MTKFSDAVFLSAGVPDLRRGPEFAKTADSIAITAAVSALVHVVLGRRPLIWGGHPSITPMVLVVAEDIGVDYGSWVQLYQSRFFEDEFPEDNQRFNNVTYTDEVTGDRERSLRKMRESMFKEHEFHAAVFIGGMGGILDEFDLFRRLQPDAKTLPVASTGGAAQTLGNRLASLADDLCDDFDYVALFHRHLDIPVQELRYQRPENQPHDIQERLWKPAAH